MQLKSIVKRDSKDINVTLEAPIICPLCDAKIAPILRNVNYSETDNLSAFLECTNCHNTFISDYGTIETTIYKDLYNSTQFEVEGIEFKVKPILPSKTLFDKYISKISPNFVSIYNQSEAAEIYNLNQIAGMGYRKAIEFLIKDYCIKLNPDDTEKIKSMLLSKVISTYIEADKLKSLATASVWIGNDETHYIKKFEDKDINDLKRFINSTISYISFNLSAEEASELLSSKRSS